MSLGMAAAFRGGPSEQPPLRDTMSRSTIRRFVLQNIIAVAAHCPSTAIASAAVAVMTGGTGPASASAASSSSTVSWVQRMLVKKHAGSTSASSSHFALVTEAEMEWIRRCRREDAEESRVVLATCPSRSVLRGIGGGALNVVLGFVISPLVFLAVSLERVRLGSGLSALWTAPCYGLLWGGVFLACAQYAAVQQVTLSSYYGCVATPLYYCVNRRPTADVSASASTGAPRARAWTWNGLRGCFEAPQGTPNARHPLLQLYEDPSVLRERAMKRVTRRDKDKIKRKAKYSGKAKMSGTDGVADDDYYGLLGVPTDATARQIKEAYNQKVLHIHPDRNPSPDAAQQFDRITKAYRVLSSPQKRRKFDLGGTEGVEDTGAKKRDAVRALFGGEEVHRIAGDVFMSSFSQRVIDGLDYTGEELAVLRQHMHEHTGLAKEVLHTIGHEYKRVIAYYDIERRRPSGSVEAGEANSGASPSPVRDAVAPHSKSLSLPFLAVARAKLYFKTVGPHRWQVRRQKFKYLATVRGRTFKDSEAMVDLAWYTSVQELEATARTVALALLYDPQLPAAEAERRRNALEALADTFILYGQPYKGANKSTMNQLMNSMREYQQQRQREKDAQ
ncbi:DnaJ domain family protein [Leishmania donovani]|uniref:DnaJ domain family protein n=1 Tax=Leishmania donovani TaxID=5661 RepID=A0A504Y109_LEIDO|nr:DnaJ domain family protein [Leishmania donovani]